MKSDSKKPEGEQTTASATLERGKKAIEAEENINKKDLKDPKVQKKKDEDAERWRNEG